jgi:hypothetical protein
MSIDDLTDKLDSVLKIKENVNENYEMVDLLGVNHWKTSKSFLDIIDKETQIKYYKKMGASKEVLDLVELESKPFGSIVEKIISEIFGLGPRTSTQNDCTFNGKKIEIKAARYWAGKDNCKWQHLEPDHDYEYILFVLLDFHGFKVWCIPKSTIMGSLRQLNIVTYQGKQGWWTDKSKIIDYLFPITSIQDLKEAII